MSFDASALPGLRKAAILMVAVGDELAKLFLQSLSTSDVQQVMDEIARLGEVPQAQLTQVLAEFYGLLESEQYLVRGGPEYAIRL
jgi:flagellar motor switch protein FliG